ncbi:uncharacterized protein B0I36DRAFT_406976 [Microdochium trichocladiopsis]|uniref:Tetratricopeptide repeat-domain-containing protein n=1 Tax=Microdochium trichocladiopsis TaxID=1682393 RepID=A0A9P8Y874_9PEZI|nr:uncharacterized protein B0I36DRAFT_406976 [Microdochium trichocladiopsis]KAH7032570.1 hypothetical protein B0I36DRAFT_406976 [Microdochium trichocladiopsis]
MNRRALDGREKALGKDHPDTLTSVSNLAGVLRHQGKYEEAEAMHRWALDGREKALGKDHPHICTSICSLAYLCHKQNRLDETDKLYGNALNGFRKVLGPSHPTTLACEGHYASLSKEMAAMR